MKQILNDALAALNEERFDEAESLYIKILDLTHNIDNEEYRSALHMLGLVKSHQNKFSESSEIYDKLLTWSLQNNDKTQEHMSLHHLGMVKRLEGKYKEALDYFLMEYKIIEEFYKDDIMRFSVNYCEQGYVNFLMGNIKKGEELLLEAYKYAEESGDPMCIACSCKWLGEVYANINEKSKSTHYYKQAEIYLNKAGVKN
jgi:tetratricopeptide (TPR) repeat protein